MRVFWGRAVVFAMLVSCGGDSNVPDSGADATTPDGGGADSPYADADAYVDAGVRCAVTAKTATRGAAIALTSDDARLITVNRDAGSVTVMSIDYTDGFPKLTTVSEITVGGEPWQVVIDGCDTTAYVVLRKDQKVVAIENLKTTPTVGKSVSVGSEPASLALTPNSKHLYVSNWVDGTIAVIDPLTMTLTSTIDLNATIAATGNLGAGLTARPALAHPRGIAITNNGDTSDDDETVYVSEWFAVRTAPENPAQLSASDTNWKGLLYKIPVATGVASTLDLPPVADTKFKDAKGNTTGCFPNQVASVTLDGAFAYVTSTCASPVGPTGVFQKGACQVDANCAGGLAGSCVAGSCKGTCALDSDCGVSAAAGTCDVVNGGACKPFTANAKTTTHPALTIVDLTTTTATTTNLDAPFTDITKTTTGTVSTRMPLLPTDVDFAAGSAYLSAEGADAVFRLAITAGAITKVGSATNDFIDVRTRTDQTVRLPVGLALAKNKAFAFVSNDGTRDVTAIDLTSQAIAVGTSGTDFRVQSSSLLPAANTPAAAIQEGKRLFNTGLGRWSLQGAAWGSCGACHIDGLTDDVTWYFARGPRQTVSLDGTFAKGTPSDQRILNWTGIFDEVADFEANIRGISGGVGAIVSVAPHACTVATQATDCPNSLVCNPSTLLCNIDVKDRINPLTQTPQQLGLQGSSADVANPAGTSAHPHSVLPDWGNITAYVQSIRSPRAPTNLVSSDVTSGQVLFSDPQQGNCIGCHSGAKWTISKVFYTPGDVPNDAFNSAASTSLSTRSWNSALNGFPAALFPSTVANAKTFMRTGTPPGFEQLQCILRPVGTIVANGSVPMGVSPAAVNVLELRQDMVSGAQGSGGTNANDFTFGFNPPSLLGLQVGAPYFHAGNARTLEEAFSSTFVGHHHSAIANNFSATPTQIKQLVAFLLSIDGSTTPIAPPAKSAYGGDLCAYP